MTQITGISGWLDKGILTSAIKNAQSDAIKLIKQGGITYAEK